MQARIQEPKTFILVSCAQSTLALSCAHDTHPYSKRILSCFFLFLRKGRCKPQGLHHRL